MEKKFTEKDIEFSEMLGSHCNSYRTEYSDGLRVGQLLRSEHRTLQATAIKDTDRNEAFVEALNKWNEAVKRIRKERE